MSKVIKKAYAEEMKQGYNLRTAMEEASRCLLCHDAPCSKSCPAKTDPAKFIRSLRFRNIKGAAETIRELVVAQKSVLMVSCVNRLVAVLELINRLKSESFRNS